MRSIFLVATESNWYSGFLKPVVELVISQPGHKKILDIGTGPGTLPEMLVRKDPALQVTGIDISPAMIEEARKRLSHPDVSFQHVKKDAPLGFDSSKFDVVTFCSVLFLMDDDLKTNLINEAWRVLKPGGKIIILTPSGRKTVLSSFIEVWSYPLSWNNFSFIIWKIATTGRGRNWQRQKWLRQFAGRRNGSYTTSLTFNNNASIETINKPTKNKTKK